MSRPVVLALALAALAVPTRSHAWGPRAHRIATRIAQERLTPAARAAVSDLLNKGDTLVDIADWADGPGHDVVPASAPWHYVNVPLSAGHYEARFCPPKGCVVSKIRHYRKVLADRQATRNERQLALLFLVHFVEDVHQPLHVGDNDDRGGNLTQVQFRGRGTNLHHVWDAEILSAAGLSDGAWHDRIASLLTRDNVAAWSRGDVEQWADESLQEAKKAYAFPAGSGRPIRSGTTLGKDYEAFALPVVRTRLAQAGVRLANELNAIFP